jgi:hypothetical protein
MSDCESSVQEEPMAKTALDITGDEWRASDDYYLDGVALNLHGFYSGVETPLCFTQVRAELSAFADLLERQAAR